MRPVGFIYELNQIRAARPFEEYRGAIYRDLDATEEIVTYLNNGKLIFAWMGYFIDFKTKEPIAPDAYYTDGVWVWPGYLSYYLNRHSNFILDKEFLDKIRVSKNESRCRFIDVKEAEVFENEVYEILKDRLCDL